MMKTFSFPEIPTCKTIMTCPLIKSIVSRLGLTCWKEISLVAVLNWRRSWEERFYYNNFGEWAVRYTLTVFGTPQQHFLILQQFLLPTACARDFMGFMLFLKKMGKLSHTEKIWPGEDSQELQPPPQPMYLLSMGLKKIYTGHILSHCYQFESSIIALTCHFFLPSPGFIWQHNAWREPCGHYKCRDVWYRHQASRY